MWNKCQKKNRKSYLPVIMIGFNILITISAAFTLGHYVNDNQKLVHDVALQGVMDLSSDMNRQLERSMILQVDVLRSIADYVEAMKLNEEETLVYLEHMNNLDGTLMLIDPQNYQGYEIMKQSREGIKGNRKYVSVSGIEVMKEACIKYQTGEKAEFPITGVFQRTGEKRKAIAFYQSVTIEGQKRVLFNALNIKEIIEDVISANGLITEPGLLIDASGIVLYYGAGEEDKYPDNFYDYQEKYYEKQDSEDIRKIISSNENGNFIQTDEAGNEWAYTYCHLGENLESSWVYINRVNNKSLETKDKFTWPLVLTVVFMAWPWLLNVGVICWQNKRLRKRQCVIEEKNQALEEANKAQVAFISNMSHEIRTPINAVLGMDEMIIRETSEEEIREYAYNIKSAGKTLLGIINDILDFTKIEAGKMDIIPQEYALSSIINDLMNMIEGRVRDKGLEFQLNMNPEIPHILYGDDVRIRQIILNILTNAVKYTEKGSITFCLDYEKLDEENILLDVAVRDTGIGMKREEMDKLSRPFERLDEKRNRTIEGTGLGMSIVTKLLMQMDSRLEVESVYGEGSVFSFKLKQKVVNWEAVGDLERRYEENKNEIKEDKAQFHASKARVLVVDDTLVNLTVVKGLLKRTGVQVDMAESGRECLEMCQNKEYHVILLDHRMPEMDGIEVVHHLQETEGLNQHTPVIALTANAVSGAYETYIKEGFCDFLSKPVSGNKLERMLLKYIPEELLDTEEDLMTQIDRAAGEKACGSQEVYTQVCKEFAGTAKKNIREIGDFYEQGDMENYTIKVHALKSSARLVGAQALSQEAAFLESCGNEGKIEEIQERTGRLLTCCAKVAGQLAELYAVHSNQEKQTMDSKELAEALTAMQEFCAAFDFDQVDSILQKLENCQLPESFEESMDRLKTAIYDVNQEEIQKIITEYLGGLNDE